MSKNKKTLFYIIISITFGIICAKYIYNQYEVETVETFNESNNIYLFQYGAYKNKDIMEENCKNIESYFYYKDKDMYYVLIGISTQKENLEKIKKALNIETDIYTKSIKINNIEFIESLKQYDNLLTKTDDNSTIIQAEKQILSKYESLVLRNE